MDTSSDRFLNDHSQQKQALYALDFLRANFEQVTVSDAGAGESRQSGQLAFASLAGERFACVISTSLSRADRLIPQLALALLQARSHKTVSVSPLPIVVVDRGTSGLFAQVREFANQFLQRDEAMAVLGRDGSRCFFGVGLVHFSVKPKARKAGTVTAPTLNLFSDTHQWLLKLLLAHHFPDELLAAEPGPYSSGRKLADSAGVSFVTANRFLQLLRENGYLDSTKDEFTLIRVKELLLRWRSTTSEGKRDVPIRFVFRADIEGQLDALLREKTQQKCVGMFGAASMLGLGFVSGVTQHVYVPKLADITLGEGVWDSVMECGENDAPDFYLRQPSTPISTFKGAVEHDGIYCTDVIQTWLDVSYHPSRGQEQANLIYEKHLRKLCEPHLL